MKKLAAALALAAVLSATTYFVWRYTPLFNGNGNVLRLPGTVEVQEVRLGSKVGGRVAAVHVREGQHVKAGEELLRFAVPELEAQREQLRARLKAAEAELLKARNGPRPEEKAEANAALEAAEARLQRLLNGWREEQKRQAKNETEAAQVDAAHAEAEFARLDKLHQQGGTAGVSRSEWELARALRDRTRNRLEAAQANYDMLMNGSRAEDKAEATAEVARARAVADKLRNGTREEDKALAEAQVEEIRGKLQEVETNLREAVVRALEPAVIEVIAVRPGDLVPPGQAAIRVLRDADLWVKVFVPETELGKVKPDQRVEVAVDSFPGKRFPGTVESIANVSEFTPRNVQSADERRHQVFAVKVRVPNDDGVFKPGMAAEVFIPMQGAP